MKRILVTLAAVLAPATAYADAAAEALFEQGIKDMQAGNLEAGCKELAASLAHADDSGTKGALATCYTRQGKVASAWNMWKDLGDTASKPEDRADAAVEAAKLEPRLPRFIVKLQGTVPAGIVVTVNGTVADPTLAVPLPIDPGPVSASARAPDHKDWSQMFNAVEGKIVAIDVPVLVELPKAPPPVIPPPTTGVTTQPVGPMLPSGPLVLREDNSGSRHSRHVIGASFAIIGVAAAGVGAIFGSKASSQWTSAKNACNDGGSVQNCAPAGLSTAEADISDARTSALVSTISFGVGGAAFVTGAIIFLSAPSDVERTTALRVTPAVGPTSYGFVLSGGF